MRQALALLAALLLAASALIVVTLPGTAEGDGPEVWFKDVDHTLQDNDDDGLNETISIAYDVDTDDANGTEVHVKLYVKDGDGRVIDDPVNEHRVANDTVVYWYHNWSAEHSDNYTFELKLYHGDTFVEKKTFQVRLEVTEVDVWFETVEYTISDEDGDGRQEHISIRYDLDTDADEANVKVYQRVYDSDGKLKHYGVVEDSITNATVEWWYYNWSASKSDDYTFWFQVYHGDETKDTYEFEARLETTEVWYVDVNHTVSDEDGDGKQEHISIAYDIDTDAANGTDVRVKLYVKDGDGRVIDDPVNEHHVANDTVEYWYHNWSAERSDNYTFELKLYHGDHLVERETITARLEVDESNGTLEVWVKSAYEDQWGALKLNHDLYDEYWVEQSEEAYLLDTLDLAPGEYRVELRLENDASAVDEVEVEAGQTSEVVLVLGEEENHPPELHEGYVEPGEGTPETEFAFRVIYSDEDNDAPHFVKVILDDERYYMEQEDPEDRNYTDGAWFVKVLSGLDVGPHDYRFWASDGQAQVDTETREGPEVYEEDLTLNIEGSVRAMGDDTLLNDLHFYAHVRDHGAGEVKVKVYLEGTEEPVAVGYTDANGTWATTDLLPGRYVWEASRGEEFLEEGIMVVYEALDKAARGDIYGHGDGDDRKWNLFKVLAYTGDGSPLAGARVQLWQGEELVEEGETNVYGHFTVWELTRGWYDYEVVWPTDGDDLLLLSSSQAYSYGPPEPEERDEDPWFRGVEMGVADTDEDGQDDTARIHWNGDTAWDEREVWVKLRVWRHDDDVDQIYEEYVLYGESDEDWEVWEWSPEESGDYAFDLLIGPLEHDATDWWEHEAVELHPVGGNHAPTLREGHVSPEQGTSETEFEFRVLYSDADNDAPEIVKLILDDERYLMEQQHPDDDDYTDGAWFVKVVSNLTIGVHEYRFLASDGQEDVDTETREGPVVVAEAHGVAVSIAPLVQPAEPGTTASFTVTVLNTGADEETFTLATRVVYHNSSAGGWTVTLSENEVVLAGGAFTTLSLAVWVPGNASVGDTLVFEVSAASNASGGNAVASVLVTSGLEPGLPALGLAGTVAAVGAAGVVASFRRRLRH